MTLWQDQPPQTRRQAREQERLQAPGESASAPSRRAATVEPTPAGEIPAVTTPFVFASGRDAAEAESQGSSTPIDEPSAPPVRPNLPTYGASFDSLLAQPAAPAQSETVPASQQSPLFRETPAADAVEPVTTPVALVPASELPPAPSMTTPPLEEPDSWVPERTLTRRELRAMLQAQEANQFAGGRTDESNEQAAPAAPQAADAPAVADPLAALFAQNPPEAEPETPPTAAAPLPIAESSAAPSAWPFAPLTPTTAEPQAGEQRSAGTPAGENVSFGLPLAPPVAPAFPVAPAPQAPGAFVSVPPVEDSRPQAADETRQPYQPPVGHWSTAGELDDKNQQFDQILSRSVGASGAATTTNALILPVVPSAPDATGPLTSTGEILVTGSIDLPRGLGSTGQHPDRYDTSDMDRMFEQDENEFNTSDVAPIRASRAVSTHTSTRGVITPPKKRGGRLPVVLSITAAVLAIGVVGLLVAGYILKVF
jgi:hypothetical protein